MGIQPDMIEYACCRGAVWGCPISIWTGLDNFKNHPRSPDNLEVIRRWEEANKQGWLSEKHRLALSNLEQEHILLLNEKEKFELQPYEKIQVGENDLEQIRAFSFHRDNQPYVVIWHTSGQERIHIPLTRGQLQWRNEITEPGISVEQDESGVILPVSNRHYLEFNGLTDDEIRNAFRECEIMR